MANRLFLCDGQPRVGHEDCVQWLPAQHIGPDRRWWSAAQSNYYQQGIFTEHSSKSG